MVVVSEFGRTFRENGNRGTDHGHGSVYWVLGGPCAAVASPDRRWRSRQANLFQDRDLPVLTDYRALIGGVLRKGYGLSPDAAHARFSRPSSRRIWRSSNNACHGRAARP